MPGVGIDALVVAHCRRGIAGADDAAAAVLRHQAARYPLVHAVVTGAAGHPTGGIAAHNPPPGVLRHQPAGPGTGAAVNVDILQAQVGDFTAG